jgi:hypothetical protein
MGPEPEPSLGAAEEGIFASAWASEGLRELPLAQKRLPPRAVAASFISINRRSIASRDANNAERGVYENFWPPLNGPIQIFLKLARRGRTCPATSHEAPQGGATNQKKSPRGAWPAPVEPRASP